MARDKIHDSVKLALTKDGWKITHDPYEIVFEDVKVSADLAAERTFAAQRDNNHIVVEIKSFIGQSPMYDLSRALGQYVMYRTYLNAIDKKQHLYLAISEFAWKKVFSRTGAEYLRAQNNMSLVIINLVREEIVEWID